VGSDDRASVGEPTKDLPHSELEGIGEFWNGQKILGTLEGEDGAIAVVDKNNFLIGVDQPAH
jgi:hypothetical protein